MAKHGICIMKTSGTFNVSILYLSLYGKATPRYR